MPETTMTFDELKRCGIAINGSAVGWQKGLAQALCKGDSTIRRWSANPEIIPPQSIALIYSLMPKNNHNDLVDQIATLDIDSLSPENKAKLAKWCISYMEKFIP